MEAKELKAGMKYFFIDGTFSLENMKEENAFTIEAIQEFEHEGKVIHSDGGQLLYRDWDKIWILKEDGKVEQVQVPECAVNVFEKIFKRQEQFNRNFCNSEELSLEEKQQKTKDFVIHLSKEAFEVLDEIDWKMHKKKTSLLNRASILEECIDVFKFLLGIIYIWEFSSDEFAAMFFHKSNIVEALYEASHKASNE